MLMRFPAFSDWDLGFHEDGFTSGVRLASEYFGARLPFDIRSPDRPAALSLTQVAAECVMRLLEPIRRVFAFFLFSILLGLWHEQ